MYLYDVNTTKHLARKIHKTESVRMRTTKSRG